MAQYDSEFEELGEPEVYRRLVAKQGLHVSRLKAAESWLALKKSKRTLQAEDSSAKRDARENESLAIAKEANSIARSATFAATAAAEAAAEANIIARFNRKVSVAAVIIAAIAAVITFLK